MILYGKTNSDSTARWERLAPTPSRKCYCLVCRYYRRRAVKPAERAMSLQPTAERSGAVGPTASSTNPQQAPEGALLRNGDSRGPCYRVSRLRALRSLPRLLGWLGYPTAPLALQAPRSVVEKSRLRRLTDIYFDTQPPGQQTNVSSRHVGASRTHMRLS